MNKYECTKCGKTVVTNANQSEIQLKCCNGDSPVKHVKINDKIIVPVTKLPDSMTKEQKPLPPSKPIAK